MTSEHASYCLKFERGRSLCLQTNLVENRRLVYTAKAACAATLPQSTGWTNQSDLQRPSSEWWGRQLWFVSSTRPAPRRWAWLLNLLALKAQVPVLSQVIVMSLLSVTQQNETHNSSLRNEGWRGCHWVSCVGFSSNLMDSMITRAVSYTYRKILKIIIILLVVIN